ncbi:MAG TPA: hypothetical protein VFE23_09805 [Usitatibacter sp.]|jgi:hypothetical protein|nr:hypothetical protein [Usitatibacter sp.]
MSVPGLSECERCSAGPRGIEGHERLHLLPMRKGERPGPRFLLQCQDCGTRWQRLFRKGAGITWARAMHRVDDGALGA